MSSIIPFMIFSLMFALPLLYFLARVLEPNMKTNSLQLFGLLTIFGEIVAFVWMISISLQGGVLGVEEFDVTPFLWIPIAISIVAICNLHSTPSRLKKEQEK